MTWRTLSRTSRSAIAMACCALLPACAAGSMAEEEKSLRHACIQHKSLQQSDRRTRRTTHGNALRGVSALDVAVSVMNGSSVGARARAAASVAPDVRPPITAGQVYGPRSARPPPCVRFSATIDADAVSHVCVVPGPQRLSQCAAAAAARGRAWEDIAAQHHTSRIRASAVELCVRATSATRSAAAITLALSPPSTENTRPRGSIFASGRAAYSLRAALTAASSWELGGGSTSLSAAGMQGRKGNWWSRQQPTRPTHPLRALFVRKVQQQRKPNRADAVLGRHGFRELDIRVELGAAVGLDLACGLPRVVSQVAQFQVPAEHEDGCAHRHAAPCSPATACLGRARTLGSGYFPESTRTQRPTRHGRPGPHGPGTAREWPRRRRSPGRGRAARARQGPAPARSKRG